MGSTEWGHGFYCCSDACGMRLGHKIRHGMLTTEQANQLGFTYKTPEWYLRVQIRWLKYLLKYDG